MINLQNVLAQRDNIIKMFGYIGITPEHIRIFDDRESKTLCFVIDKQYNASLLNSIATFLSNMLNCLGHVSISKLSDCDKQFILRNSANLNNVTDILELFTDQNISFGQEHYGSGLIEPSALISNAYQALQELQLDATTIEQIVQLSRASVMIKKHQRFSIQYGNQITIMLPRDTAPETTQKLAEQLEPVVEKFLEKKREKQPRNGIQVK